MRDTCNAGCVLENSVWKVECRETPSSEDKLRGRRGGDNMVWPGEQETLIVHRGQQGYSLWVPSVYRVFYFYLGPTQQSRVFVIISVAPSNLQGTVHNLRRLGHKLQCLRARVLELLECSQWETKNLMCNVWTVISNPTWTSWNWISWVNHEKKSNVKICLTLISVFLKWKIKPKPQTSILSGVHYCLQYESHLKSCMLQSTDL